MPDVRNKTIRRRVSPKMRIPTSDVEKVRILRTLYILVYNSDVSIFLLVTELFHILGDILEGVPAEELEFKRIDKELFLKTYADLSRKET